MLVESFSVRDDLRCHLPIFQMTKPRPSEVASRNCMSGDLGREPLLFSESLATWTLKAEHVCSYFGLVA